LDVAIEDGVPVSERKKRKFFRGTKRNMNDEGKRMHKENMSIGIE